MRCANASIEGTLAAPVQTTKDKLMATAKKTGIFDKVKGAVSNLFSSTPQRKSPAKVAAGKKAATTAKVNKAVTATKKVASKVAGKVAGAANKTTAKKAARKR